MNELTSAIEAVLFAAGDSVPVARLSLVLGAEEGEVEQGIEALRTEYESNGRGLRILRLEASASRIMTKV